ncbi:DUF805 domain-containing protein [Novosphingobium sp.]|uniref:DUF805 domain-containing protein n=1 Tax=Novosphingobium sp. TaxID=1874826 RepID=UPI003B52A7E7
MLTWMFMPYRRYAEFGGRSQRAEYWYFSLFLFLVAVLMTAIFAHPTEIRAPGFMSYNYGLTGIPGAVLNIFNLASFIPSLAVGVRRLHDQDRSGWLMLLILIPLLGWFALFVLMCLDGTHGPNSYGPDPKHTSDVDAFS